MTASEARTRTRPKTKRVSRSSAVAAKRSEDTAREGTTISVISSVQDRRKRDGKMVETNGGSSIENVPGFNNLRPMTAGFDTARVSGPTMLASVADGGFFSVAPHALEPSQVVSSPYGMRGKPEDV